MWMSNSLEVATQAKKNITRPQVQPVASAIEKVKTTFFEIV